MITTNVYQSTYGWAFDVVIMVHQGAGTTLAAQIHVSSTTGITMNTAISGNTKIIGVGATTYGWGGTPGDIALDTPGITSICPKVIGSKVPG